MTDTQRLNWLEQYGGVVLVSGDAGHWAVSFDGFQDVTDGTPQDVWTEYLVLACDWKPSIREAIDAAMKADDTSGA